MGPYYVTTPIYYVNDRPHIGHCYTTLVADAAARFARVMRGEAMERDPAGKASGRETRGGVFFLTGTDEHADKVVTSAAAHGMTAIQWADRNAAEFERAFAFMRTSHDDFIRTTQARHKEKVTEYVGALMKSGAIYKGTYEGWYDENQEEYVTETVAKEGDYKSPVTGKPLVRRSEACYFFRLSAYQARLEEHFQAHPTCVEPAERRNEVLGRLRDGLNDVPISRPVTEDPATQFGIRVPGDDANRIYVWIDALFNYLSVVDTEERRAFWPPAVHLIAKDILWFHAVIWPAMLMALKDCGGRFGFVTLPRMLYCHSYWVREGKKMSKSLGNFVTLEVLQAYASKYGLDALRWYLLTQGPMGNTDADFSHEKFVEVYNSELANGIGNCASRVANMIEKYFDGIVPDPLGKHTYVSAELTMDSPVPGRSVGASPDPMAPAYDWVGRSAAALERVKKAHAAIDLGDALLTARQLIMDVDAFISFTAPFKLAKAVGADPRAKEKLAAILYNCAEAIRVASLLFAPACPERMRTLWSAWGLEVGVGTTLDAWCVFATGRHSLRPGQRISKGEALFMRADPAEAAPA